MPASADLGINGLLSGFPVDDDHVRVDAKPNEIVLLNSYSKLCSPAVPQHCWQQSGASSYRPKTPLVASSHTSDPVHCFSGQTSQLAGS